jgi:hypothetical protein
VGRDVLKSRGLEPAFELVANSFACGGIGLRRPRLHRNSDPSTTAQTLPQFGQSLGRIWPKSERIHGDYRVEAVFVFGEMFNGTYTQVHHSGCDGWRIPLTSVTQHHLGRINASHEPRLTHLGGDIAQREAGPEPNLEDAIAWAQAK